MKDEPWNCQFLGPFHFLSAPLWKTPLTKKTGMPLTDFQAFVVFSLDIMFIVAPRKTLRAFAPLVTLSTLMFNLG